MLGARESIYELGVGGADHSVVRMPKREQEVASPPRFSGAARRFPSARVYAQTLPGGIASYVLRTQAAPTHLLLKIAASRCPSVPAKPPQARLRRTSGIQVCCFSAPVLATSSCFLSTASRALVWGGAPASCRRLSLGGARGGLCRRRGDCSRMTGQTTLSRLLGARTLTSTGLLRGHFLTRTKRPQPLSPRCSPSRGCTCARAHMPAFARPCACAHVHWSD